MINMISQALMMGYTTAQVLNFIGKKIPNMTQGINSAKGRGYSDDDILKFLQGKIKVDNKAAESQASDQEKYLSSIGLKTQKEKKNEKAKFIKGALGIAGTALGAYQMYQNYSGMFNPSQRGQGGPQIGPQPGTPPNGLPGPVNGPISPNQPENGQISPQNGPQPPPIQPNSAKGNGVSQPKMPKLTPFQQKQSQMPHDPKQILDDMGLTPVIENLQQAGNEPEAIKAAIEHQVKPFQRDWLRKQTGLELEQVVDRFINNQGLAQNPEGETSQDNQNNNENEYGNNPQTEFPESINAHQESAPNQSLLEQSQQSGIKKQETPKQKPLSKGSTVITPDGDFAKIEDLPGKTAKIDVDGKKRVIEADEAIPIPENEDEILGLYEKLIAKIPESLRSSMLNWVGYDPERNLLQVKFHNGDSYTYEDIPPEFASTLKDAAFLAKTTGGNYYGTWEQGESSRGAGVSQLIKDLQKAYGGKGKEYTGKFKEVYSFLGLPEEKLREKLKREREEKKKRKGTT